MTTYVVLLIRSSQEEILGFSTTQIHYVLVKWDKVY
jgi:hypothetical protein